ncbi:MAG: NUDIX domain-containing protein [Candidatus Diapherotrites archaeon]|nr:NUDIX domain-containing protein [Candidatus Diapherotrites archaeon]
MRPGIDYIGVGVGALIFNDKNELLMLLRKKAPEKGKWMIPGGRVEFNERLADAITREVEEELGVTCKPIKQLKAVDHIVDNQHWVTTPFVCTINGTPNIMEPEKHEKMGWFSLNNLPENTSLATRLSIERWINE